MTTELVDVPDRCPGVGGNSAPLSSTASIDHMDPPTFLVPDRTYVYLYVDIHISSVAISSDVQIVQNGARYWRPVINAIKCDDDNSSKSLLINNYYTTSFVVG